MNNVLERRELDFNRWAWGMGGAQQLAAVMVGACCLAVECDEARVDTRMRNRYFDEKPGRLTVL